MANLLEAGRTIAESLVRTPVGPELFNPSRFSALSETLSTINPVDIVIPILAFPFIVAASMEIGAIQTSSSATISLVRGNFREALSSYKEAAKYAAGGLAVGAGIFAAFKAVA